MNGRLVADSSLMNAIRMGVAQKMFKPDAIGMGVRSPWSCCSRNEWEFADKILVCNPTLHML